MITPEIKRAYDKAIALDLPTILMRNNATGEVFVSHFSASCYGLFYEQVNFKPENK